MAQQYRVFLISGAISVALGFLAGYAGGRLAAPPSPEKLAVLRTEGVQLVDQAGKERGRLGLDREGAACLTLAGQDAAPLVSLSAAAQGGASLRVGDESRRQALVLTVSPEGSETLDFYREGQLSLGLEVQPNGEPTVNLYDKGKRLLDLGLTKQGDPHLSFYGDGARPALELISRKNGDRSLTLGGKDGVPRVVLGLKHDQKAALGLFDRQGKTRAALLDEPSLILLKNGKVVRSLP
ncbi:MAG: hypothetical protein M0P73_06550 [Syntrophobacterales bacterium]|jgi:hypothetical protein|nr:hypothetical protein [Syntrophobacterales bacterium]